MLNVSFHPSEIGEHLDLLYIHFKCGAMRELTQFACMRQVSSILPDALVRDLWSRTGRETLNIKEHYETGCMCVASVNSSTGRSGRYAAWGRAERV